MLGTVKMPDGTTSTLEDDGYWTHPDMSIQCNLNVDYSLHGRSFPCSARPVVIT